MAGGAKIAVIGVGKMGEYHVGVLSEMREADLVGIVDVNEDRARSLGEKYEVPWFTDPKELYGKVDLVVIAVPTELHFSVASGFLDAGIHVLLEKPCANNLKDARELFKIADSKNLILQIGHIERFNAAVQEMHKIVTEPIFIESKRMSPFPQRIQGDGVVLDIMIHDIDIVLNLVQSPVNKLNVMGTSVFTEKDDVVNAQFQFENGCLGSIIASRASQNKIRTLSVTQKDSYVMLDYTDQEIYVHRQASSDYQLTKGSLRYKQESLIERIFVHKENPLKQELKHFIDCVQNGIPRKVTVDSELYSLEIALDILAQL
jgi:predicted dehydrogenase